MGYLPRFVYNGKIVNWNLEIVCQQILLSPQAMTKKETFRCLILYVSVYGNRDRQTRVSCVR